jgi:hypothetical protein
LFPGKAGRPDETVFRIVLAVGLCLSAQAASPVALTASLADVSIPPGGTVQLQVFMTAPAALASGSAVVKLDPAVFDNIDLEFSSQTAGVGRLPSWPLFTVAVPFYRQRR